MARCFVPSNPGSLLGRAKEQQEVLDALERHRCVIISGRPGEGKTALAQQVVWDLWERGELPGGAYPVNLPGDCLPLSQMFRVNLPALPGVS